MQYRPTATELLTTLAELLEDTLLPALPPELRHQARVGAHLARLLERELRLGPETARREREARADLDPADEAELWAALVEIVRADLSIAKPGYDAWEGE
ncbi:DUF6285 domain-containing protein [Nocardia sp. NPDC088792]|uniref:DUF6285 domain-containing protein n=1 Tax=Nocardia sp. NPDC088792 TaxID=3364332 RepID=UPI0038304351